MSFMRCKQHPRSCYGVKKHISALDVAAEQVLGSGTKAGGENRSRAYPGNAQLLVSNVCPLQPHATISLSRLTHRFMPLLTCVCSTASAELQDEYWLRELLHCVHMP